MAGLSARRETSAAEGRTCLYIHMVGFLLANPWAVILMYVHVCSKSTIVIWCTLSVASLVILCICASASG